MLVSKSGVRILEIDNTRLRASSVKGMEAAAAEIVSHVVCNRIC